MRDDRVDAGLNATLDTGSVMFQSTRRVHNGRVVDVSDQL